MELDQLRSLVEVVRERSFTRAAERLFLTQPAVSLQIKALEEEVGHRLLERQAKRVTVTDAGRILLRHAQQILSLVDRAQNDLSDLGTLSRGRLSVGTSDTNFAYVLPATVQAFREAYPGVDLKLTQRMSPEIVQLVSEGEVDLGLVTTTVSLAGLVASPLFDRVEVVVTSPSHQSVGKRGLTIGDLADEAWVMLTQRSTSRGLTDALLAEHGFRPDVSMELGSVEVMKRFVEIGMGVALVPEISVQREVKRGDLAVLDVNGLPKRQVSLVSRPGGYLSPAADAFIRVLRAHL